SSLPTRSLSVASSAAALARALWCFASARACSSAMRSSIERAGRRSRLGLSPVWLFAMSFSFCVVRSDCPGGHHRHERVLLLSPGARDDGAPLVRQRVGTVAGVGARSSHDDVLHELT